jgi:hypothetical protein
MGGRGPTERTRLLPAYAVYRVSPYCRVTRSFVAWAAPIAALSVRLPGFKNLCRTRSSIVGWSTSTGTHRRP